MNNEKGFSQNGSYRQRQSRLILSAAIFYIIIIITLFLLIKGGYDIKILSVINHNRLRPLDKVFIFITDTAYIVAILIPTIILVTAWITKRHYLKRIAYQVYCSLFASSIVTTILKYLIHRDRPFINHHFIEKLSTGGSPSFPSGHTADAFTVGCTIIILADNRMGYIIPVWLWALAVAYSRLALGVHYPSDVVGSIFIGVTCAALCNSLFNRNKNLKSIN